MTLNTFKCDCLTPLHFKGLKTSNLCKTKLKLTKVKPGLGAFYTTGPGKRSGQFYGFRGLHGAV